MIMQTLSSLRDGYVSIVIGASGGIGSAFTAIVEADPRCARVFRLSRQTDGFLDICDEPSIAAAAENIRQQTDSVDLVFNATGVLLIDDVPPENTIKRLNPEIMARHYWVNAIGPALLIKHLAPLLPKNRRSVFGSLSARVGSIGDNNLGGWISYRAAKAAQNQVVRTASIELARSHPEAILVALHPGTVATSLSDPFASNRERLRPEDSASMLLDVLDSLTPVNSGGFFAYDGNQIEW